MVIVNLTWSEKKSKRKKEVETWRTTMIQLTGAEHCYGINVAIGFLVEGNIVYFCNLIKEEPRTFTFDLTQPGEGYRSSSLSDMYSFVSAMQDCQDSHVWISMWEFENAFKTFLDLGVPRPNFVRPWETDLLRHYELHNSAPYED